MMKNMHTNIQGVQKKIYDKAKKKNHPTKCKKKRNIQQKLCLTLILTFATFLFKFWFYVFMFHFRLASLHNTYCMHTYVFHTIWLLYFLLYEHYLDFQFSFHCVCWRPRPWASFFVYAVSAPCAKHPVVDSCRKTTLTRTRPRPHRQTTLTRTGPQPHRHLTIRDDSSQKACNSLNTDSERVRPLLHSALKLLNFTLILPLRSQVIL